MPHYKIFCFNTCRLQLENDRNFLRTVVLGWVGNFDDLDSFSRFHAKRQEIEDLGPNAASKSLAEHPRLNLLPSVSKASVGPGAIRAR